MPASRGGLRRSASAHRVRVGVRRAARARGAGSGTRRRGDPGQRHLGVGGAGQREVGVRGRAGRRRAYIRSRQVQNVPPPSWVRPRSARWKAASGRWRSPGSVRPAQPRRSPRRRARRRVDRGDPAVGRPSSSTPAVERRSAQPGVLGTSTSSRSSRPAPRSTRGERVDAGQAVGLARRARPGECETPVGLRTNSIAVGHAGRGEDARRRARRRSAAPAPVRRAARGQPVAQRRRRSRRPAVHDSSTSVARRRPRAPTSGDHRVDARPASAPRASSQAVTCDGIALTPFGLDARPCRRSPRAPARSAAAPGRQHGVGEVEHRVVRGRPAGWCRRGWPRRRSRAASGRAARSRWPTPTGAPRSTSAAALLDVQLDERADPAQRLRVRADRGGSSPAAGIASASVTPVGVASARGPGRRRARR